MKDTSIYTELVESYCGFASRETRPGYSPQTSLSSLGGVEVALWDIYGTLFATRAGDLEGSLSAEDYMLRAFEEVIDRYALESSIKGLSGFPAQWLRGRYISGIEKEHARLKAAGYPVPEVRIEEIWRDIFEDLCQGGLCSARG